ncbi:MAG: DUF4998 domain-containing protein [Niabella sp.]|nr:DUF4998 domain-containing protein [Niabella sp.]
MNRITNLFFAAAFLALIVSSCDKMNDIQKKYADKAEQVYLGRVDSVQCFPGVGRAKLVWYMNADPKIERTIIYWNSRHDSLVVPFNRTALSGQRDSVYLDSLPEGSTLLEFKNVNSKGESSLVTIASATVWGTQFAGSLTARTINAFDYDYSQSRYNLSLLKTFLGDSVIYSQISYTTKSNTAQTITINRADTAVVLTDFPPGGSFQLRTTFFPPQGIDTVRSAYQTYNAPAVVANRGVKIAQAGNINSKYFNYNGDLGEWNPAGDLIVYTVNADGSLTQKIKYPALVSRTTFREFFFYDGDRFIGIQTNNNIYMYRIVNGVLTTVKTPGGADNMGAGFTFLKYAPARGFFYSIAETTGEIKSWSALTNATWGTPNGNIVGTGFTYVPYALFNFQTLMGVDATGYLWTVPVYATGAIGSKSRMGLGWTRFKKIICVGSTLYGMESNGDLYVFNNFDATGTYWIVN